MRVCFSVRASLLDRQRPLTQGLYERCTGWIHAVTIARCFHPRKGLRYGYIGKLAFGPDMDVCRMWPLAKEAGFQFWEGTNVPRITTESVYYDNDDPKENLGRLMKPLNRLGCCHKTISRKESLAETPFMMILSYGTPHAHTILAHWNIGTRFDPEKIQLRRNVPLA